MKRAPSSIAVAITGAVAVVVFVAGVAAIFNDDEDLPVAGARIHLDGTAVRLEAGGRRVSLSDGDILHAGDRVDVTDGSAVFELAGGGSVEGRAAWNDDVDDTSLTIGAPMELLAGDALAVGPGGVAVEAAGTTVTLDPAAGDGAARIRRDLAVTTATYEGTTAVDSAGQHRDIHALRQLSVSSVGRPAADADPLDYDPSDPWDLRYLAGAIDATRQLDSLARSLTARGAVLVSAADYKQLLPRLASESSFDASFIDADRPVGDSVVGAAIAVLGGRGDLAQRWDEVFDFRDDGAAWGLVALDQDVTEDAVIDDVTDALERLLRPDSTPDVASPPVVPDSSDDDDGSSGGSGSPATIGSTTTTTPPSSDDGGDEGTPPTLLPPIPPIDIPGLPPITIPTLPPLDTDPLPDSGGLLAGLLAPIEDVLDALIGPSGLLDAS